MCACIDQLFVYCRKRRTYIDNLRSGYALMSKAVLYTYTTGNSLGSIHFLWRVPEELTEEELLAGNLESLRKIQPQLPTYHTRAMRKQFFEKVSLFRVGNPV